MLMKKSCYHMTFEGFCFEFGCATRLVVCATPFYNQAPIANGSHQLTLVLMRPVYNWRLKPNGVANITKRFAQPNSKQNPAKVT